MFCLLAAGRDPGVRGLSGGPALKSPSVRRPLAINPSPWREQRRQGPNNAKNIYSAQVQKALGVTEGKL